MKTNERLHYLTKTAKHLEIHDLYEALGDLLDTTNQAWLAPQTCNVSKPPLGKHMVKT